MIGCCLFYTCLLAPLPLCSLLPKEDGWQDIPARSDENTRPHALYRAKVPKGWQRAQILGSTLDTRQPICAFTISNQDAKITLVVHNFPFEHPSQRVPALSQITRWKRQLAPHDPLNITLSNVARGGFVGLCLEILEGPKGLLAWSMQVADEHALKVLQLPKESLKQKNADYTIKATGPSHMLCQYREQIKTFASSFELIEEFP